MAKNSNSIYNFKIITPYKKGGSVFSFSYEDHKDKLRKYEVRKTDHPVSDFNMAGFWKIISKHNGKPKVFNIWMIPELRQMDKRGYVEIENMDPIAKDDPMQMKLPPRSHGSCPGRKNQFELILTPNPLSSILIVFNDLQHYLKIKFNFSPICCII